MQKRLNSIFAVFVIGPTSVMERLVINSLALSYFPALAQENLSFAKYLCQR